MTGITALITASSPVAFYLWCAIGFCAGIAFFFYGFRLLQRRRLILDTPFSKIRSASLGMVEISGLAVGPYAMVAPITAKPCYYFHTLVWEWEQRGKNKEWVKVAGECMHVPFFVDDNTGRMLIDPRGAELHLHRDFDQEFCDSFFTTKEPAPENVRAFLARHGIVTKNRVKVEEFCIKPKNSLFLLGTLAENPGIEIRPQPIQDSEGMTIATSNLSIAISFGTESSPSKLPLRPIFQPIAASQPNHPMQLSSLSYGAATAPALAASSPSVGPQVIADPSMASATTADQESTLRASGFDPHPPIVLMKGTNNKTFLISWRSQREVVRVLGWKSTLMIWGGPLLALLSLYFFLSIERLPRSNQPTPGISHAHHASKLRPQQLH